MTDQFKEYLQYQPFLVKTDNNPLTYVMLTPNLDTISHQWVAAMVGYNFQYCQLWKLYAETSVELKRKSKLS